MQALQKPHTGGSEGVLKTAAHYPNVLVVLGLESPAPNPFLLPHQACWSVATPGSGGNGLGPDFHSICTPSSHWKHHLLCLDPLHAHLFHTLWGEAWRDTDLLTRQLTYSPPSASGNSVGKAWGAPCWWMPCSRPPASLGGSFPALADRSATTFRDRKTATGRGG